MVTSFVLTKDVLTDNCTQLHVIDALTEELIQPFAIKPKHAAGHHCLDGCLCRMTIEEGRIVANKLTLERKPSGVCLAVADAVIDVLETSLGDKAKPTGRVALTFHLIALAVSNLLSLTLTKLM